MVVAGLTVTAASLALLAACSSTPLTQHSIQCRDPQAPPVHHPSHSRPLSLLLPSLHTNPQSSFFFSIISSLTLVNLAGLLDALPVPLVALHRPQLRHGAPVAN